MGRELRIIDPESVYHAMCRGSNRGPLAWDRHDYESLLAELHRVASRYRWRVLAWCFMPTHHHVLLRTPSGGFSEGFQVMNGNHSRRTNRRHGRTDHLFRNRPHAIEVKSDAHLVGAILYIVRNPMTAGLCERAAEWRFSSYQPLAGLEPAPSWLALEDVLPLFGSKPEAASAEFARIVHDGHLPVSDTDREPQAPTPARQA